MTDDTQQIIARLRREKRAWKYMCISFMISFAIAMTIIFVGMDIAFKPVGFLQPVRDLVEQTRQDLRQR